MGQGSTSGFTGILCCGGRGERLGAITQYVSKALVPVYDRPVFMYPLQQLAASRQIVEIVILTNTDNDEKLRNAGYKTVVQDDARVCNMITGAAYVCDQLSIVRPVVLMPCDNVSDICVDDVIGAFTAADARAALCIRPIGSREKLRQMGVFDPQTARIEYRPAEPRTSWGVLAPFVLAPDVLTCGSIGEIARSVRVEWREYRGPWFDVGDPESLCEAAIFCRSRRQEEVGAETRQCR